MPANKMFFTFSTAILFIVMVLSACPPAFTATQPASTDTPAVVQAGPTSTTAAATFTVVPATELPTAVPPATTLAASSFPATPTEGVRTANELILATTTNTRDTGLLDVLLPLFEKQCSCKVKMIAVGIGAALQMGQTGNADGPYSLTSF